MLEEHEEQRAATVADQAEAASTDGRVRRAQRSRAAIADALYELVAEGQLEPTAREVAERAGVGLRSVFRHFQDMDSLYTTLHERLVQELTPLFVMTPPHGPPLERVTALAAQREEIFERIGPFKHASDFRRQRSGVLRANHLFLVRRLRENLERWLPELPSAAPELFEAADQAASFEAWSRLRDEQRLDAAGARAVLEAQLAALVERAAR